MTAAGASTTGNEAADTFIAALDTLDAEAWGDVLQAMNERNADPVRRDASRRSFERYDAIAAEAGRQETYSRAAWTATDAARANLERFFSGTDERLVRTRNAMAHGAGLAAAALVIFDLLTPTDAAQAVLPFAPIITPAPDGLGYLIRRAGATWPTAPMVRETSDWRGAIHSVDPALAGMARRALLSAAILVGLIAGLIACVIAAVFLPLPAAALVGIGVGGAAGATYVREREAGRTWQ